MRKSKKHIPLSCLGPGAIKQLREAGVNVEASLAKERGRPRSSDVPFHKFNVRPGDERTFDGIKFDSKLEMNAYKKLKEYGIPFTRQPEFILQERFEFEGHIIRPIKYVADFQLVQAGDQSCKPVVLDMKGMKTYDFMIKRKLLLHTHGIEVHCLRSLAELVDFLSRHGFLNRNSAVSA